MKKPELILPAGTLDMLKAAVLNGADAVYFGSKKFNARIPAKNFEEEEIKKGIDFCHFYGKKAYLTINILLKDSELKEAIELAKKAYCLGIDAVIAQDLGFIKALRELLPGLEIHASTQTTCHNLQGAEMLAELGVKKIVLARELNLSEIKEIKQAMIKHNVEIECFIHGALCFSYSGQCLFSSFAFNKSGNRGQCLQPCRLEYDLYEKEKMTKLFGEKKKFALSMKDLNTLHGIKELTEAGIDSFKVEGRLKGISYVAAVTQAYRKAIDDCFAGNEKKLTRGDENFMKIAFSREPTKGYAFEEKEMTYIESPSHRGILVAKVIGFNQGMLKLELFEPLQQWDRIAIVKKERPEEFEIKKMFIGSKETQRAFPGQFVFIQTGERPFIEMGAELHMVSSRALANIAFSSLKRNSPINYNLRVFAVEGEELNAVAEFANKKARINSGFVFSKSKTTETTSALIQEKVFKSSEFFAPGEFSCEIKGKPFVPLSILKDFKAIIAQKMEETLFEENRKKIDEHIFLSKFNALLKIENKIPPASENISFAVFVENDISPQMISEISKHKEISAIVQYFSGQKENVFMKQEFSGKEFFIKSPNIQTTNQVNEFNLITKKENIVCSNLGALWIAVQRKKSSKEFKFWVDRELNIFNSLTEKLMLEMGAEKIIPSIECSFTQVSEMNFSGKLVPLVFFYPLLMTSKAYSRNPAVKTGNYLLVDRKKFEYKVKLDENKLLRIYNPVPVDMLFELEKFYGFELAGIDLISMNEKESLHAIKFAMEKLLGKNPAKKFASFTRGHYEKELE